MLLEKNHHSHIYALKTHGPSKKYNNNNNNNNNNINNNNNQFYLTMVTHYDNTYIQS